MDRQRQTPELIALVLLFLAITAFTVFGFLSRDWLGTASSEHGAGVDRVIGYLAVSTGAILIIGTLVMVGFLWRFGRGLPAKSPLISAKSERWWTIVPVLSMALIAEAGVLVIGLPVWEQVYGEVPDDALIVEANAQQFEWIIRYPGQDGVFGRTDPTLIDRTANPLGLDETDPAALDDVFMRNDLHLPAGRTALVRLRSRDVLHSFSIAEFRVKQDVVPGMIGRTMFVPTTPGEYEIGCAEICGMGHYQMGGTATVLSETDFDAWMNAQTGWRQ